jgi:assimilatory nitrate reductase electron transfer subunit
MMDSTRVVVVGAGMVGHRFAEELHRLDPSVDITLLGEEEYEPYNRILLTELLAGRVDLAGLTMP